MRSLLILSAFLLSLHSNANAATFTKQMWSLRDDHFLFTYEADSNMLMSSNCFNEDLPLDKSPCQAARVFREKRVVKLKEGDLSGGKNPGAMVCKNGLHRVVRVLKDNNDNENAFCVFEDGSMISAILLQSLLKE